MSEEDNTSPNAPNPLFMRFLVSVAFATVLIILTLFAGWSQAMGTGSMDTMMVRQDRTITRLQQAQQEIMDQQRTKHTLPKSLVELPWFYGEKVAVDDWGQPLHYAVNGTHFTLKSYGADGKPGGTGLNSDLTSESKPSTDFHLTMYDFLTNLDTREMVETALVTGLIGGLLCFVTTPTDVVTSQSKVPLLLRLFVTLLAAAFVALMITAVHVPSGH